MLGSVPGRVCGVLICTSSPSAVSKGRAGHPASRGHAGKGRALWQEAAASPHCVTSVRGVAHLAVVDVGRRAVVVACADACQGWAAERGQLFYERPRPRPITHLILGPCAWRGSLGWQRHGWAGLAVVALTVKGAGGWRQDKGTRLLRATAPPTRPPCLGLPRPPKSPSEQIAV